MCAFVHDTFAHSLRALLQGSHIVCLYSMLEMTSYWAVKGRVGSESSRGSEACSTKDQCFPRTHVLANHVCAGCHKNGGNILQPGATLFEEDLAKNGVDSPEALFNIIYAGKNKMPGYGTDCTPRVGVCATAGKDSSGM